MSTLLTGKHHRQLSEVKITDPASLQQAVEVLHTKYNVPHVVITSVSVPLRTSSSPLPDAPSSRYMSVVGSSRTSAGRPRLFKIHFPVFDCYFSGSGDMFAALMVVRMREAIFGPAGGGGGALQSTPGWLSPDDVAPLDLPLARAAEKVLASMHEVLSRTCESMEAEVRREVASMEVGAGAVPQSPQDENAAEQQRSQRMYLLRTRAAELRLVRNLSCLRSPSLDYRAEAM